MQSIDFQTRFIDLLQDFGIPTGAAKALWMPIPMILIITFATLFALVTTWMERKVSAAAQQRIGPEFMGPFGVLVPIADVLKLLTKENIIADSIDRWLFTLAPLLVFVPVFLSYLVVPFGQTIVITNLSIGIFLWVALSSIAPIGLLMAGYSSNNKYSLLGGLRAAAQSISYEVPLALSVLAVVMMSNSLSTIDIVQQQSGYGILGWNLWRQPIGLLIFWIAALAECERLPFDLPEAEEELVAGHQTEYTGIRFMLFYGTSYTQLVLSGLLFAVLYLGGWEFPVSVDAIVQWLNITSSAPVQILLAALGIITMLFKAYLMVFLAILIRWTVPRVRIDQILDLGWKFMLPIALVNLIATAGLKLAFPAFFGG